MKLQSPWPIKPPHSWPSLATDLQADTVILGAGISGIATLYSLLTKTDKNITVLDKGTIASGATGHNAGLAVAHIERPIEELIEEIGLEKTQQAYQEMEQGWHDLIRLHELIGLHDNLVPFESASLGFTTIDGILEFININMALKKINRPKWEFFLSDDEDIRKSIESCYLDEFQFAPASKILSELNTQDSSYIGTAIHLKPIQAGRMNGVRFCYQLLAYLTSHYGHRFSVYENTRISKIELSQDQADLHHEHGKVQAKELILCTNGYTHFQMVDKATQHDYTYLHQTIIPREGFLGAYKGHSKIAHGNAYFRDDDALYPDVPYWYLSQIPDPAKKGESWNFIGGPEFIFPTPCPANFSEQNAKTSLELFQRFLRNTYNISPQYDYFWRGVMGYTESGMRLVGRDAHYPSLWYNLGCNGIGIVTAISSADKIASLLKASDAIL